MNVERVIRMPVASPVPAVLEVVLTERRPGRFRGWLARLLVRLAGRVAGMRVRIVGEEIDFGRAGSGRGPT